MISGKGLYVWRAHEVLRRMNMNATEAARTAKNAGIEHIIIKIADGGDPFPIPDQDPGGHLREMLFDLLAEFSRTGGQPRIGMRNPCFQPGADHARQHR